jgi:hypothetical protein
VVADAFTASARAKIEAAGGSVNVLEIPASPLAALGVTPEPAATKAEPVEAPAAEPADRQASATAETVEPPAVKAPATKKAAAARTSPARTSATKTPATKTPETKAPAKTRASKPDAEQPADGDGPLPPAEAEPPSGDDA